MRMSAEKRKTIADDYRLQMKHLNVQSGVYLSFSKLSYTVKLPLGPIGCKVTVDTPLLKDVSGFVKPGMMMLLLGPPGAGKTTLLELLAGRKPRSATSIIQGEIKVDGKPWSDDFNRIAGYVTQEDIHFPTMTVRETFMFSSKLRNHALVSDVQKEERVDLVLDLLGLSHVADTVVGNELLRGVSGGEKKRVSIGVELVNAPGILFLDEPTTGLDAAAAIEVVQHLRHIADAGVPVICSLLQPSQDIFDMFDSILVLNDREMTYFGPMSEVLDYYEETAGYRCPTGKNVAEFLLEIHTEKAQVYKISEASAPVGMFPMLFQSSVQYDELGSKLWKGIAPLDPSTVTHLHSESAFATGVPFQAIQCTARAVKNMIRNPAALRTRVVRSFVMGLLLGSLFWQMDNDLKGANNRISLLFFCITFTSMGSIASIPQVCEERRIFYHQRASHFYQTMAYFVSATFVDFPLSIVESLIFTGLVFWMSGMNSSDYGVHFLMYFGVLFITNMVAKQFCRMCAAATPNIQIASRIAPGLLSIWLVFAGFLIPRNTIPDFWIWMNYISPFRYTLEAMAINEMVGEDFVCKPEEMVPEMDEAEACFNSHQACPIGPGTDVLRQFGLYDSYGYMWMDFGILWGFYALFCAGTFFALAYLNFNVPAPKLAPKQDIEDVDNELRTIQSQASGYGAVPTDMGTDKSHGAYLSFHDLCYTVHLKRNLRERFNPGQKQLLFNVNGYGKPGLMVALMGASGAGKTTLLDVLAERKTGGFIGGQILINGRPMDKFSKRMIGYVEQMSVHMPTLTVSEAIRFSAHMRLPPEVSDFEKERRVDDVIDKLGLRHVANVVIGEPDAGGISPELRKKTSIGVEMVAEPSILYLDEPTSGLDSQAAEAVMDAARVAANTGVPIICTIHQPSEDLFLLFDWVLLLKPGGRVIYFGPLGEGGSTILEYFRRHGLECGPDKNPADFVLECSGAGIGGVDDDDESDRAKLKRQMENFDPAEAWLAAPESRMVAETLAAGITPPDHQPTVYTSEYATSVVTQTKLCIRRAFTDKFRRPEVIRAYIMMYVVMALIIGTLYWQLDDSQLGARNRVALIYFSCIFAALGAFAAVPSVVTARAVFYREKPSFLRPFAYFVAQSIADVPFTVLGSAIFSTMVYFMAGLNLSDYGMRYVLFVLTYSLTSVVTVSFAQMVAVISPTLEVASSIVGVSMSILSLFAGFIIPKGTIPIYWIWLHYASFFKYPLEALSLNEMIGEEFGCPDNIGTIMVPTSNFTQVPYCTISSGTQFIHYSYDMYETWGYFWIDLGVLAGIYVLFLFLTFLGVKYVNHMNR